MPLCTVVFDGKDLGQLSSAALAEVRNRQIGFIFQLHHLLPQCSVLENVLLPTLAQRSTAQQRALRRKESETRALYLLGRVGLASRLDYRPGQLSGGERQRVAVVRALINEPKLLLADEPTGSLDHTAAQHLIDLLIELNHEEKVTLIVVTHARELACRMSRVARLEDGRLGAVGGGW